MDKMSKFVIYIDENGKRRAKHSEKWLKKDAELRKKKKNRKELDAWISYNKEYKRYLYDGQMLTLAEIASKVNINYVTLRYRVIYRGWTLDHAINTPVQEQNSPSHITGTKKCSKCKMIKPISEFSRLKRRTGNEFTSMCRKCDGERCKKDRQDLRRSLIGHYSNGTMKCEICGENRFDALDLDHIHGGGIRHRKQFSNPTSFYRSIVKDGFPEKYRVLCRNCNWIEHLKKLRNKQ